MARPDWPMSDLPQPPAWSPRNTLRILGPGTALMAISLGAGEWLFGPAVAARHGASLLWLCTVSVLLQGCLSAEMARYTLATGEPIWSGFVRTRPGAGFWAWTYTLLHGAQLGWPGWALASATTLVAAFLGRAPRAEDHRVVVGLGYLVLLAAAGSTLAGGPARATIRRIDRIMLAAIPAFLLVAAALVAPWRAWTTVAAGFLAPLAGNGEIPPDADRVLLLAFAAYCGAGGTVNATFTQWLRDKGFGMAAAVGEASGTGGALFPPTEANMVKWRGWERHLSLTLAGVCVAGPLAAMTLPVVIAVSVASPGTSPTGFAAVMALPESIGERHGPLLWASALVAGGWIYWATQRGAIEGFTRVAAELLGGGSGRSGARPHRARLAALAGFTLGGAGAMAVGDPLALLLIGAGIAGVNVVVLSAHTLWVNRSLLPGALRPPLWREAGVVACAAFFAVLVAMVLARPQRLLAVFGG